MWQMLHDDVEATEVHDYQVGTNHGTNSNTVQYYTAGWKQRKCSSTGTSALAIVTTNEVSRPWVIHQKTSETQLLAKLRAEIEQQSLRVCPDPECKLTGM